MSSKVRVGIVGARFAARFHLEAYHKVYGVPVEVVGMTSKSKESREAFAAAHGLKAFDSLAELLNAVDVVDICAPGYVHETGGGRSIQGREARHYRETFHGLLWSGSKRVQGESVFERDDVARSHGKLEENSRRRGRERQAADVCRELGVRTEHPERARDSLGHESPGALDHGRGIAQRVALAQLWDLVGGRRRIHCREVLPPDDGGLVPEARGRAGHLGPSHSTQDSQCPRS